MTIFRIISFLMGAFNQSLFEDTHLYILFKKLNIINQWKVNHSLLNGSYNTYYVAHSNQNICYTNNTAKKPW